jgi:hypothetical protein
MAMAFNAGDLHARRPALLQSAHRQLQAMRGHGNLVEPLDHGVNAGRVQSDINHASLQLSVPTRVSF